MSRGPRSPSLLWSPHESEVFAIGSSEQLKLYQFVQPEESQEDNIDGRQDGAEQQMAELSSITKQTDWQQGSHRQADEGRKGKQCIRSDGHHPSHHNVSRNAGGLGVQLISAVKDVHGLTCAAWSPRKELPWMLAIGTAAGKVVIHDCTPASAEHGSAPTSARSECVPHSQRMCCAVAWNSKRTEQIAAGLDKVRLDYGVLVWDIERQMSVRSTFDTAGRSLSPMAPRRAAGAAGSTACRSDLSSCMSFDISAAGAVDAVVTPLATLSNSEAAVALSWLPDDPHGLLVGTSFRWMRLYDVRTQHELFAWRAHTKAVYGVTFDPFNEHRFITFSDDAGGVVKGWDVRKMREGGRQYDGATLNSLFTINAAEAVAETRGGGGVYGAASKGLLQVDWCPTRRGLLGTISDGLNGLLLWDVDRGVAVEGGGTCEASAAGGAGGGGGHGGGGGGSGHGGGGGGGGGARGSGGMGALGALGVARGGRVGVGAAAVDDSPALTRCAQFYECGTQPSTFCWHAWHHSRLLLLLRGGPEGTLRQLFLSHSMPLSWSPKGPLVSASRERVVRFEPTSYACNADGVSATLAEVDARNLDGEIANGWRSCTFAAFNDVAAAAEQEARAFDMQQLALRVGASGTGGGMPGDALQQSACGLSARGDVHSFAERVSLGAAASGRRSARAGNEASAAATRSSARAFTRAGVGNGGVLNSAAVDAGGEGGGNGDDGGGGFSEEVDAAMCWRVGAGYGLDPATNIAVLAQPKSSTCIGEQFELDEAWKWVHRIGLEGDGADAAHNSKCPGAIELLMGSRSFARECSCGLKRYESSERSKVIRCCGWHVSADPTVLEATISQLESAGQYERAAVAALFQAGANLSYRELERAVRSLERGGSSASRVTNAERTSALKMMAMVVAGFQPAATLWWSTVHSAAKSIQSPHLRLALAILCSPQQAASDASGERELVGAAAATRSASVSPFFDSSMMLQHVLLEAHDALRKDEGRPRDEVEEVPLRLSDGLALACRFLPDSHLHPFLTKLLVRLQERGFIGGICLTGVSGEAIPLLQGYIDRTADVQSASLLVGACGLLSLATPCRWLGLYRDLLNRWQLWHERCALDIAISQRQRHAGDEGAKSWLRPLTQVHARCSFCSTSLQTGGLAARAPARGVQPASSARHIAPRPTKASACPKCKKPLPRCALCLQHLGCPEVAESSAAPPPGAPRRRAESFEMASSAFSHWMVWCQSCRHGGHVEHVLEWFSLQLECPVSGCACRCALIDGIHGLAQQCAPAETFATPADLLARAE